jgi:DNA mismatch endonuclease (patch repair protein)
MTDGPPPPRRSSKVLEVGGRDPAVTSRIMAKVRNKNSRPELVLRRYIFSRGLRYRVHVRRLPGSPDIVFPRERVAVFVDGDFWHGFGWRERGFRELGEQFRARREFWEAKIRANMAHDANVTAALSAEGWHVIRVLTSALLADPITIGDRIIANVYARRGGRHT